MLDFFATPAVSASISVVLALVGLAALARQRPRQTGTTLVAVGWWAAVSLLVIAGCEVLVAVAGGSPPANWVAPLRLTAAMSTFCPVMALLGAKRPQDRAWQFIVATLWIILSLPSVRWLLFGGTEEMHPAQLAFLGILIGTGLLNGLATRAWLSSALYCVGQSALVSPFFTPTESWLPGGLAPLVGLIAVVASLALPQVGSRPAAATRIPLDRVWLDFRDAFGAVWGLRIMERMNASSAMYGWGVTLGWSGFNLADEAAAGEPLPPIIEQSLRTLLRRFVSSDWIDQRVAAAGHDNAPALKPASVA